MTLETEKMVEIQLLYNLLFMDIITIFSAPQGSPENLKFCTFCVHWIVKSVMDAPFELAVGSAEHEAPARHSPCAPCAPRGPPRIDLVKKS